MKAVTQKRRAVLEHYRAIERSLRDQEKALKEGMDPAVRQVMGSKKLLLFKQMLADAGVPDENLFEDMVNGFRLTGNLEPSGLFPPKYKPAVVSVEELRRSSQWAKHLIESACRQRIRPLPKRCGMSPCSRLRRAGLLARLLGNKLMSGSVVRGLLLNGLGFLRDKVRAVDDQSQFQINASVTETEKIQQEGLDDILPWRGSSWEPQYAVPRLSDFLCQMAAFTTAPSAQGLS